MRALTLFALLLPFSATAADIKAWPPALSTENGWSLALRGAFRYDLVDVRGGAGDRIVDADAVRRRELGISARHSRFDFAASYDFEPAAWQDVALRIDDVAGGSLRVGHVKTPVAWESAHTSATAIALLELSAPVQAVFQGRRNGVVYVHEYQERWRSQLGYYSGSDLNDTADGHTVGARGVWTPVRDEHNLVHLGVALSRESRSESARFRAGPETALTPVRLVDSGVLATSRVDRGGLEAAWRHGPFSLQGEWLTVAAPGHTGAPDFRGHGHYLTASWSPTGEVRPYRDSAFGNLRPERDTGALELVLRHSVLDLDDGPVRGGQQDSWTLGINWYLGRHVKLQGNYVAARAERAGVVTRPDVVQARVQLLF